MKSNASLDMERLARHFAPNEGAKNGITKMRLEMLGRNEPESLMVGQLARALSTGIAYGNWHCVDNLELPEGQPTVMRVASPFELMVAQMVLDACTLQQSSYDHEAADAASVDYERKYQEAELANPGQVHMVFMPSYEKFYIIDLETACEQVAGPLGRLIYLALEGWWNDTVDWAKMMLDPDAVCAPGLYNCQHGVAYSENLDKDLCLKCTEFWKKQREEEHEESGA